MQAGHISANTIEACRIAANQYIRGDGKLYIRIFPNKPVTARPLETRMGKGKGEPDHWVAVVKPGTVLFEIAGMRRTPPASVSTAWPTSWEFASGWSNGPRARSWRAGVPGEL